MVLRTLACGWLVLVGCGPAAFDRDAGSVPLSDDAGRIDRPFDAGLEPDAGLTSDAGVTFDAGVTPDDAGTFDAGERDAGLVTPMADAGSRPDAGTPSACAAVPVTPFCPTTGWCWRNPAPFATQLEDVVAFGCEAFGVGEAGAIVHRTATGWQQMVSGTTEHLYGIAGSAPDDLWAVGSNATIVHSDGTAWQVVQSGVTMDTFRGAYVPERGVLFIAASNGIHRFENGVLTTLHAPTNFSFKHLTGTGRSFMRAVGDEVIPNVDRRAATVVFDGTSWRTESSLTMVRLNRVALAGTTWFAAGSLNGHGPDYGYVAQLFPTRTPLAYTQAAREFYGLAATGPNSLIAVGQGFSSNLTSFDGTTYTPIPNAPVDTLKGVAFGGRESFVVGQTLGRVANGTYVAESEGYRGNVSGLLVLSNGDVWLNGGMRSRNGGPFVETIAANLFADLGPVAGDAPNDLWASGSSGVWHFDGTTWSRDASGPSSRMNGVRARGGDVWAWKWNEVWVKYAAGAWQRLTVATTMSIDDLWPLGNQLANVVGRDGSTPMLWVTNGSRFSAQPSPPLAQGDSMRLVRGEWLAPWVVSGNGLIFRFDGSAWHAVALPTNGWVYDLFTGGGKVLVATERALLEWNGTQLGSLGLSTPVGVVTVDATGAIWAGGNGGTVVVRR